MNRRDQATATRYLLAELVAPDYTVDRYRRMRPRPADVELVAARLEDLGVRGSKTCVDCPIANYLRRHGIQGAVFRGHVQLAGTYPALVMVALPPLLQEFVGAFDEHDFPEIYGPRPRQTPAHPEHA